MAVSKIERGALAGSADILKWWTLMANNVSCELFFSQDFDALERRQVKARNCVGSGSDFAIQKPPFVKDLETSMIIGGVTAEFHGLLPILEQLPIPPLQRAFAVWDRLRAVGEVAIQNTRASSGKTIFAKMANPDEKLQLSEESIAQEASNLTIAGTDTTAIALTYLVWVVLRNPEMKHKLQAESETCSEDLWAKNSKPSRTSTTSLTRPSASTGPSRSPSRAPSQPAEETSAPTISPTAPLSARRPTPSTATRPSSQTRYASTRTASSIRPRR